MSKIFNRAKSGSYLENGEEKFNYFTPRQLLTLYPNRKSWTFNWYWQFLLSLFCSLSKIKKWFMVHCEL